MLCSAIEKITEQETAHPSLQQLSQLTIAAAAAASANAAANGAVVANVANDPLTENITISHEIEERAHTEPSHQQPDSQTVQTVVDVQDTFHLPTASISVTHSPTMVCTGNK